MIKIYSILLLFLTVFSCTTPKSENISVSEENLRQHISTLASDNFEGRAPSTPGEEKTINYLAEQFEKVGAAAGNGNSYFQDVPMIAMDALPSEMAITAGDNSVSFQYQEDMMAFTERIEEEIEVTDSEIVFAGFGIVAPEYNWNDYEDLDATGKTVVVLVNDPGYYTEQDDFFSGKAMTYYGRYTYKYEEAARQGAEAILVIHQTGPAGYPWEVVSGSWSVTRFGLKSPDGNAERAAVEGWITEESARTLFENAGLDFENTVEEATKPGFSHIPLNQKMSVSVSTQFTESVSKNVIAKIPGQVRPDEFIIYSAHWDHLGTNTSLEGDQIYNGANDNATGTSALIELARMFAQSGNNERTLIFLAVTAEEKGLLGSRYYSTNPIYPLENTVANLNMDAMNTYGPTNDVEVVGYGNSQLDDYLKKYAQEQGRTVNPEATPERGYYYRSDHFNFAKAGVPALYTKHGMDHTELGREWMEKAVAEHTANRYHKPSDEYSDEMDLRGMVQDLNLFYKIGNDLANSEDWPEWNQGVSFKAERDKQRK